MAATTSNRARSAGTSVSGAYDDHPVQQAREARRVTVSARDPGGLSATRGERVERLDGGPRAVGTIPLQTVDERAKAWFLAFPYFMGPKREQLEFRAASADQDVATVEVSGRSVTVAGVAPGTTTATITARDPAGREASQQVRITVQHANRPPRAVGTIPEQATSVGDMVELDLAPYFTDPDGDPLQYEADVFFDKRAVVSMAGSLMSIIGLAQGHTRITVRANDPDGEKARQLFLVTVDAFSRPPDVVGTFPRQTLIVGDTLVVDMAPYFGDPGGDVPEYEADSSKDLVTVSMSGSVVTIVGVGVGRTYVVVSASGPGGRMAIPVRVIQPNRAPEAAGTIPSQAVTAGKTTASLDLSACFHDPDDDRLEFSAATSDESVATASVSGSEATIHGVAAGNATVTVTARDPEGLEAEQSFAITVWSEDGVTGTITGCRVFVDLLLVRTVHIEGTVRAHRSVGNVEVHVYAAGRSVGVCALGDLAAGEEKPFSRSKATLRPTRQPRCSITISWREVP